MDAAIAHDGPEADAALNLITGFAEIEIKCKVFLCQTYEICNTFETKKYIKEWVASNESAKKW